MKKTYINPSIEVIKIVSQTQMLAGSGPQAGGTTSNQHELLGRDSDSDWEDEDW